MSHLRSSTAPGLRAHPCRHGTPLCSLQTLPSCFESTSTLPSSAQHLLAETHPNEDLPGISCHAQPFQQGFWFSFGLLQLALVPPTEQRSQLPPRAPPPSSIAAQPASEAFKTQSVHLHGGN